MKKIVITFVALIGFYSLAYCQDTINTKAEDSINALIKNYFKNYNASQYKEALNLATTAVNYSYELNNATFIAKSHYILGHIHEVFENYEDAKKNYQNTLKFAKEARDTTYIIYSLNGLGNVFIDGFKQTDKAITYYKESAQTAKAAQKERLQLNATMNIGWTYLDINQFDKALPYLKEVLPMATSSNIPEAVANIDFLFGRYYAAKNLYDKAFDHFNKSIAYSEANNMYYELVDLYEERSLLYEKKENPTAALADLKKHLEYKEKLFKIEELDEIQTAQARFDVLQYKRELETAKKEKAFMARIAKNQKTITYISIMCCLLLIGAIYFFYKNHSKNKLNAILNEQNKQLEQAKLEAEKFAQLKSQFVSTVSHEIRTPLYGIIGITSLLLEEKNISKEQRKYLNSLKFSGDHLINLINNVLKIGEIESQDIKLNNTPTNIIRLINNIFTLLNHHSKKQGNIFKLVTPEDFHDSFQVDAFRLSEVLFNLIGNANKFTKNGTIWVRIQIVKQWAKKARIRFEIEDTGIGIPKDKQALIFENFSQLNREHNSISGTGLGLSIVKHILKIMNSSIHLKSKEQVGSTFFFELDLEYADKQNHSEDILPLINITNLYKILVVEDNKISQMVTKRLLKSIGHECVLADDGFMALELAKKERFDLIFMDLNMPLMDGFESSRKIRQFNNKTPIVALTATDLSQIRDKCLDIGMNGVLNKPLDKMQIQQNISKYLDKKRSRNKV